MEHTPWVISEPSLRAVTVALHRTHRAGSLSFVDVVGSRTRSPTHECREIGSVAMNSEFWAVNWNKPLDPIYFRGETILVMNYVYVRQMIWIAAQKQT